MRKQTKKQMEGDMSDSEFTPTPMKLKVRRASPIRWKTEILNKSGANQAIRFLEFWDGQEWKLVPEITID